ncbi:MAG: hypothetical protein ACKORF_05565 [Micrococcales bacterium]
MTKFRGVSPTSSTSNDSGITFVEVLMAMAITLFISLLVMRVTFDASKSLDVASARSIANLKVIKFTNQLRYDIAGAFDVFVFGKHRPTGVEAFCSSDPAGAQWDNSSSQGFVRPLFSIRTVELEQPATPMPATENYWVNPVTNLVTYEIRIAPQKERTKFEYELWRYECSNVTDTPTETGTKMLDLGGNLQDSALTGLEVLSCDDVACPEGGSSAATSYYSFGLPYDTTDQSAGRFESLKIISKNSASYMDSLHYLTRKVDE